MGCDLGGGTDGVKGHCEICFPLALFSGKKEQLRAWATGDVPSATSSLFGSGSSQVKQVLFKAIWNGLTKSFGVGGDSTRGQQVTLYAVYLGSLLSTSPSP